MAGKVVVFGSFVVDLMARIPHLPVPGETVKGPMFKMGPGGKGFNQCVAAHKAGADVTMITKIGNDRLDIREATALVEKLLQLENPFTCPHGRPTIIEMTQYELEKRFKRIQN